MSVAATLPLGPRAVAVVLVSLAIGVAYSTGPLLLSYRTWLAHLVLAVTYVAVPFALGAVASEGSLDAFDAVFAAGLFSLFLSRIVLKDFRDRRGDALYGKPTLLLRWGKSRTCAVSFAALLAGDALLSTSVESSLVPVVQLFVVAIALMLRQLHRAREERDEQVAIGIGARVGNGLLLTTLGVVLLAENGAAPAERLTFALAFAAIFGASFATLAANPDQVLVGYKG